MEEFKNTVSKLIELKELRELRNELAKYPPADIAEIVADLPVEEGIVVFRIVPRDMATEIFEYLPTDSQTSLLNSLGDRRVAILLNEMAADDRTALFEEIPAVAARRILNLLSKEERAVALSLLGYPESSVGRLMTPDYVSVKADWTISQVLEHIRTHGQESDSLNTLYVVDDKGHLTNELRLRDVLLAPQESLVKDIFNDQVISLEAIEDQEQAVLLFRKYGRTVLPVVDSFNVLIGIVTIDDVLDVAEEEATEDIQKFGGSEALNEPYLRAPFSRLIKTRATWLVVLFVGEMLTASAMAFYEDEIAKAVVLALFVPLIISSGGNSGSQAATLVIRALSIGEIELRDWFRVLRREISSGLILGLILGTIGFLRIAVWSMIVPTYGEHWMMIGFVVFGALISVVMWGTISGAMLPFILKKVGADPAASSAPFVATVVDVFGLVIYFTIASFLLKGILL